MHPNVRVLADDGGASERVMLFRCSDVDDLDTLEVGGYFKKVTKATAVFSPNAAGPFNVSPVAPSTNIILTNGALLNDIAWVLVHGVSAVA